MSYRADSYRAYLARQASEREIRPTSGPRISSQISNTDSQEAIRLIKDFRQAVVCATAINIDSLERERLVKRKPVESEGALFKALTGRDPAEGERKSMDW
jgi:hypothetical protein